MGRTIDILGESSVTMLTESIKYFENVCIVHMTNENESLIIIYIKDLKVKLVKSIIYLSLLAEYVTLTKFYRLQILI